MAEVAIHDSISHVFVSSEYVVVGSASGMVYVIPHQGRLEYFLEPLLIVRSLSPVADHPAPSLRMQKILTN